MESSFISYLEIATGYKRVVAHQDALISSQGLYSNPQDNTKETTGLYKQK